MTMTTKTAKVDAKQLALQKELAGRILSRRRLLPFIQRMNPKYLAGWVHEDICRRLERFSEDVAAGKSPRLMLLMPPRHGKACAVGTPVPTPTGFRPIETLAPGDFVFGRDGKPTRVVAVSEVWRDRELFEVVADDGAAVIVDAEHEWTVRLCRKRPVFKAKTTRRLSERTGARRPALMTYSPVEYPAATLPVHPYVLGVWLGDGTPGTFGASDLHAPLRALGLLQNKHIPASYLHASTEQRRALLQGLVDTDGHVAPDGQVEFCSTNAELARHTLELVRSLGVKASMIHGDATLHGSFVSKKYRVMFYMAGAARLPQKAARCHDGARSPHRFLSCRPAGRGDTVCIQVEAEDHQYLVGHGYLLTHNSEIASKNFPAWHLGRYPDHEFIACSYNLSLAMGFSRKVKQILDDPLYQGVFEGTRLDPNNQSTEEWGVHNHRGGYVAAGIGGPITGKGAHVLVIDDPVKNAEEADSADGREKTWEWYLSTAYSRLAPGGGVLVIQCMTGDTPVLMADGAQRRLDTVQPGDSVATYDRGALSTSTVAAVRSNGRDRVLKITTTSGRIVRANGRHPFLTSTAEGLKWVRARSLNTTHKIVALPGSGGSGKASPAALTAAPYRPCAGDSVRATTTSRSGPQGTALPVPTPSRAAKPTSSTATASPSASTPPCSSSRVACAESVSGRLTEAPQATGRESWPSTTATTPASSEGCSATTATQESDILELSPWHLPQPGICDFTLDQIASVEACGEEEVFDLQIDRTENFIANGLVSHNTWWHDDDLAGRLQQMMAQGGEDDNIDQFEVVKYPALAETDEWLEPVSDTIVRVEHLTAQDTPEKAPERLQRAGYDPSVMQLLRLKGEALHPARYDVSKLLRIRAQNKGGRWWSALYQQNPVPDDGAYFTKDQFRRGPTPGVKRANVYIAFDFAISEKKQNDYTVGTVGLQDDEDILHVADVLRFKSGDAFFIVEAILNLAARWYSPTLILGFEDGQIWRSIEALLRKRMRERKFYPSIEVLKPITDKMARARVIQGRMQQGMVSFNSEGEWYDTVRTEMLRFPAGVHDDCVDSLAWMAQMVVGREAPRKTQTKRIESWKDRLNSGTRGSGHMVA